MREGGGGFGKDEYHSDLSYMDNWVALILLIVLPLFISFQTVTTFTALFKTLFTTALQ